LICQKCWRRDPRERPNMSEVVQELMTIIANECPQLHKSVLAHYSNDLNDILNANHHGQATESHVHMQTKRDWNIVDTVKMPESTEHYNHRATCCTRAETFVWLGFRTGYIGVLNTVTEERRLGGVHGNG